MDYKKFFYISGTVFFIIASVIGIAILFFMILGSQLIEACSTFMRIIHRQARPLGDSTGFINRGGFRFH